MDDEILPFEIEGVVTAHPRYYFKTSGCDWDSDEKYYGSFFIQDATGAKISIEDSGLVRIASVSGWCGEIPPMSHRENCPTRSRRMPSSAWAARASAGTTHSPWSTSRWSGSGSWPPWMRRSISRSWRSSRRW